MAGGNENKIYTIQAAHNIIATLDKLDEELIPIILGCMFFLCLLFDLNNNPENRRLCGQKHIVKSSDSVKGDQKAKSSAHPGHVTQRSNLTKLWTHQTRKPAPNAAAGRPCQAPSKRRMWETSSPPPR